MEITDSLPHLRLIADDRSSTTFIKREVHQLALRSGFSPKRLAELDLIVSELVTNLLKYAGKGEILVRPLLSGGLELLSLDNGPGMENPIRMVQDGVSTSGTLGHGLGSIQRLADQFELYSIKGWGTIVLVRITPITHKSDQTEITPPNRPIMQWRSIIVAKPGQEVCGDGCRIQYAGDYLKVLVADGLGHGPGAQRATEEAIRAFRQSREYNPVTLLRQLHQATSGTRGLVGTVVIYDQQRQTWSWCGVGNILLRLVSPLTTKTLLSHNGIIGVNLPGSLLVQSLAVERGQTLVLCSDGIRTTWDSLKYPLIGRYDLSILAAAIYKDYARYTDDMTVVVGRRPMTNG